MILIISQIFLTIKIYEKQRECQLYKVLIKRLQVYAHGQGDTAYNVCNR